MAVTVAGGFVVGKLFEPALASGGIWSDYEVSDKKKETKEDTKMNDEKKETKQEKKMSDEKEGKAKDIINTRERKKERIYKVVVNQEDQYSIWPADQKIPKGWERVGPKDTKEVCLSYVKEVWTDMRPKSIR